MSFWENFKKTLNTDIKINWGETVKGGVEASKQVFEVAKVLNDKNNLPDVSKLSPYLQQTASLLDVLNSPLEQLVGTTIPFVGIATSLLAFLVKNTQQELSIEASIFLVVQGAYLESFQDFFNKYPEIKAKLKDTKVSEALAKEIHSFGEQLQLNENEAKKTLISFHDSNFAIAANKILERRLVESGFNQSEATIITQRISRNTHRFLKEALAENRDKVSGLAAIYGQNWETELKRYASIDTYLKWIAEKPQEKIFEGEFTFESLYVPLRIKFSPNSSTRGEELYSY